MTVGDVSLRDRRRS